MSYNLSPYARRCARLLRLLPAGMPGKSRLARLLLGAHLADRPVKLTDRFGSRLLVPSLRESIAFYLLIDGVYEPALARLLRERLSPGGSYIDVGANIGAFVTLAARLIGYGSLLAVEPSRRMFPFLQSNVAANARHPVRLANVAALDQDLGGVPFYEAPSAQFGMGALAPQFDAPPQQVPALRLDTLCAEAGIRRADLIKVDVEGFEALVFRGAERLLTGPHAPAVVFEFCDWAEARAPGLVPGAAQAVLRAFGYQIWRLDDYQRGGPPLAKPLLHGTTTLIGERVPATAVAERAP